MNTQNPNYSASGQPSSTASQAQLERDIDRQRDHIGGLLDALESKLSPGEMFERVLGYGKGGGREFASNLGDTVKANPLPTLITAAGLMWLYSSKNDGHRPDNAYHYGIAQGNDDAHDGMRQRVRDARDGISEKMGDAKTRVSDAAHDAMDSTRQRARQANNGFHHMLEENPMAVGAMGIAVGAMLGAMLPSTRKEDEMIGEASDDLVDDAKSLAKRGLDRAAQAGREVSTPQRPGKSEQSAPH